MGLTMATGLKSAVGNTIRYNDLPVVGHRNGKPVLDVMAAIPTVEIGSRYSGVVIHERNRATVYARTVYEVGELLDYCVANYQQKGVNAVLVAVTGVQPVPTTIPPLDRAVAVFVEDGFLEEVDGAEGV